MTLIQKEADEIMLSHPYMNHHVKVLLQVNCTYQLYQTKLIPAIQESNPRHQAPETCALSY